MGFDVIHILHDPSADGSSQMLSGYDILLGGHTLTRENAQSGYMMRIIALNGHLKIETA
jgi:hypothetical protein